jgi:hypothetical protein
MSVTAANYESLKGFYAAMLYTLHPRFKDAVDESNPLIFIETLENKSKSIARKSLAVGISDLLEEAADVSIDDVRKSDGILAAAGLPTMTEVRLLFGKRTLAIVTRGKVRSEAEYYALRSVVEAMPDYEQQTAWDLLVDYEASVSAKPKRKTK